MTEQASIYNGLKIVHSIVVLGKLDRDVQKNKTRPHARVNSKWIKDLNVRPKTMKILEENAGSKILDIACSNIFFRYISSGKETKEK